MRDQFSSLCRFLNAQVSCDEDWSGWLEGESTHSWPISRGRCGWDNSVDKTTFRVTLHKGMKRVSDEVTLTLIPCEDRRHLSKLVRSLRDKIPVASYSTYEKWSIKPAACYSCSSWYGGNNTGFCGRKAVAEILDSTVGIDFEGTFKVGWAFRGFGSSRGHYCWVESNSFCLDFSVYNGGDIAARGQLSGKKWDRALFRQRLEALCTSDS